MQTSEPEADRRRRRKRRSGSVSSGSGRRQRENNRRFGLGLFAVMVLIAAGAAQTQLSALIRETPGYGPFLFGTTGVDAHALGAIAATPGQPLALSQDGATYAVELGSDNRVRRVSCREIAEPVRRCDSAYGVRIGMSEVDLHRLLGRPDARLAGADDVLLAFAAPGLRLRIRDGSVVEIERAPTAARLGLLHLAVLRALP